jgi:hypothetical protein
MNRDRILSLLKQNAGEIQRRFSVKHLSLFGSAVHDALRTDGDIDILVEFEGPATFSGYMGLKFHLESLLGRPVDLVTGKGLRKELRPSVEKEAIRVA